MRRIIPVFFIVFLILAASACSSKKPPEQAAVRSKNILSVLRDLNKSYEKKDLDAFLSGVASPYSDREAFARSLAGVFSKYETIHFNIQYTKMLIMIEEKGTIKATFTWDGEWIATGGATVKDGGRVTFAFEPKNFKLISIEGKNPFLAQPGETPGAKP